MAKTCQTGLAPRPGSANVPIRRNGTVLACVSPAGLTTVPSSVATPSASNWAMAAAASGVAAMTTVLDSHPLIGCPVPGIDGVLQGHAEGVAESKYGAEARAWHSSDLDLAQGLG